LDLLHARSIDRLLTLAMLIVTTTTTTMMVMVMVMIDRPIVHCWLWFMLD
jgi:hypothetical protein